MLLPSRSITAGAGHQGQLPREPPAWREPGTARQQRSAGVFPENRTESVMKLVKLNSGQIGLFVLLPKGAYAIDIVRSLGVFAPHDALSNGLLNGVLKDGCNWSLVVKHWAHLRSPLKKLARIAMACPDHPQLVLQSLADDLQAGDASNPIVAIEVTDIEAFEERDPTGRRAMERQFISPPDATLLQDTTTSTETAQVIDFSTANKEGSPRN